MSYGKISTKQREILEYIKQEILNKGYPLEERISQTRSDEAPCNRDYR